MSYRYEISDWWQSLLVNLSPRKKAALKAAMQVTCAMYGLEGGVAEADETQYYFSNPSSDNMINLDGDGNVTYGDNSGTPTIRKGVSSSIDYITIRGGNDVSSGGNGANNNTITIDGGSLYVVENYSSKGDVKNNTITINDALTSVEIIGGHSYGSGTLDNNKVIINNGELGSTVIAGAQGGANGTVTNNSVEINGGTISNSIQGGYVESGGTVANNTVTVTDGTINAYVYGGMGDNSSLVQNNKVEIKGGTFTKNIYASDSADSSVGNSINIYNSIDLSNSSLYGFYSANSHSDNALNVYDKNVTAKNIYNFDNINFYLPDSTVNGDTILTLTGGSATDISGTAVKAGVEGNANLNVGDTVTLLKNASGITDTGTTYGTLTEGVSLEYDMTVAKSADGKSVVATIGAVPQDLSGVKYYYFNDNVNNNIVTIADDVVTRNGSVVNYDSKVDNAYNGTVIYGGNSSGDTSATGNNITVNGGSDIYSAIGGYSNYNNADTTSNTLTINNSKIYSAIGGYSYGGNANFNTVNINNAKIEHSINDNVNNSSVGQIIGGYSRFNKANGNNIIINELNIDSLGNIESVDIYGGHSDFEGYANNNIVSINDGNIKGHIYGGSAGQGEAIGNTVNVNGGNITGFVTAGRGQTVSNNTVNINNGTIKGTISGGQYGAGYSSSIESNTININGGVISGAIYASYSGAANCKNNEINIYNSPNLTNVTLYGTNNYHPTNSGNALNIYTKDLTAKDISYFDNINIYLPDDTVNGDTILTLTGGSATDISGTAVKAGVEGNANLNVGDTVTLLKNASGITDSSATTYGKLTEGVSLEYDMTVAKSADGNSVVATIGAVPPTSTAPYTIVINDTEYTVNGTSYTYSGTSDYVAGETTNATSTYTNPIIGGTNTSGTASDNVITVNGGTLTIVVGADNITGTASNNTVNINGGTIGGVDYSAGTTGGVMGGALSQDSTGTVSGNTVNINGGTISGGNVFGGAGGYNASAVNDNVVNISGGTVGGDIFGGMFGGTAGTGELYNNSVNISSGTVNGNVYGAYTAVSGKVHDNSVTINGGTFNSDNVVRQIYGGYLYGTGDVYNNTVNIYNSPHLTDSTIYGGYTVNGNSHDNTLNIYTKDLTAQNIANFENINFYLPTSTVNGDTVLTLTDTAGTDISGAVVKAGVQGNANLSPGDTVTLLKNDSGITDTGTTYGTLTEGVSLEYELTVQKADDNTVTATIGGDTPPTAPYTVALHPDYYSINGVTTAYDGTADYVAGQSDTTIAYDNAIIGGASSDNNASGNIINIHGGTFSHVEGAGSITGTASNNTVTVEGGTITQLYGAGFAGAADNNTVNISGGTINNVTGGGADVTDGKATGNIVNISGGTVGDLSRTGEFQGVRGGLGYIAENNTVNISGGTINGYIYGGTANGNGTANNNTINIRNAPILNAATLIGGASSTNGNTGNTLNIYTKDLTAQNIVNFDNINFYLPDSTVNGDTVLTLTDTAGTNISGSKVNAGVKGNANLNVGDTVTLLKNDSGITDTGTTYGELTEGVSVKYDLKVEKAADGNSVNATILSNGESEEEDPKKEEVLYDAYALVVGNGEYSVNGESSPYSGKLDYVVADSGTTESYANAVIGHINTTGESTGNSLTINGGTIGYAAAVDSLTGDAANNTVIVNGGTIDRVYGAGNVQNAIGNTVTINGGTVGEVKGGSAVVNSLNNTVNINGGTVTGQVAGGACENAVGNTVNISGGTLTGEIYGGKSSATANNNTINIRNAPILNAATLIGGASDSGNASGNTLNVYTKDITAQNIKNFNNINFYLPTSTVNGDTVLTLNGGAATDISGSAVKAGIQGNANLNVGDTINLLKNDSGIVTDGTTYGKLTEGVSLEYDLTVMKPDNNTIMARIDKISSGGEEGSYSGGDAVAPSGGNVPALLPKTAVLATSTTASPTLISNHIDTTLKWLPPLDDFGSMGAGVDMGVSGISGSTTEGSNQSSSSDSGTSSEDKGAEQLEQAKLPGMSGFNIFANVGGSVMRTNTGKGSHVDSRSRGFDMGAARAFASGNGIWHIAPVVDYGTGSYDSYLADGTHGSGTSKFCMGGVIARHTMNNGMYYEGSFRYGRASMDFASGDMLFEGKPVKYETSAPCWAGHINVGYRLRYDPYNTLDLYGIYFHTHQGAMETDLSSGETYRFDAITNQRLRLGARLTRMVNDHSRFYSGIAYEYTRDGAARGTYLKRGRSTEETGNSGSSFMLELGYQYKPSKTNPWMADVALVGWAGHQRGFSVQAKLKKAF